MVIAIVDDYRLIAETLRNSLLVKLATAVREIRIFKTAEEYLNISSFDNWVPDLIISDLLINGVYGPDLLEFYRGNTLQSPKVIFLSSVTDISAVRLAIRSGVDGYLSKDIAIDELYEAISDVMAGEQYVSRQLQKGLLSHIFAEEQVVYHLSPREKEVLRLVCSGNTIKEAAYKLSLSAHTVQSYHKNIMKKFNVHCTADLVVFAMQRGLYSPSMKT